MGTFKRPIVGPSQKGSHVDFNRAGQYSSRALQEVLRHLAGNRSGVLGSSSLLIAAAGAGNFDVVAQPGIAFQHDATGLGADESPYRVIELVANTPISMGGAPPAAGTYYVHVRWGSADGQSEVRESRAAPGAPFVPGAVNTARQSAPVFLVDAASVVAGYLLLAEVVVPGGAADSTAYTITDRRRTVGTPDFVYQPLIPIGMTGGIEVVPLWPGRIAAVANGTVQWIVTGMESHYPVEVTVWGHIAGGAAECQVTMVVVNLSTGAARVTDTKYMVLDAGMAGITVTRDIETPLTLDQTQWVVELGFNAGGGRLDVAGAVAKYARRF